MLVQNDMMVLLLWMILTFNIPDCYPVEMVPATFHHMGDNCSQIFYGWEVGEPVIYYL